MSGKPSWFAVRRGDILTRCDAKYFVLRDTSQSARFPLTPLAALVSSEPDYGAGSRAVARTNPAQPRYIRITDFGDDGIEPGHEYVTAEPLEPDCELGKNDLLFARSGATVGKTYLHEDTSEPALFAGYCIRFRFRDSLVLPKFVYWFTKTEAFARWVATIQRPAGQPNINKEEFKTVEIPLPEKISEQQKLVATMDAARAERRAKLAEADALLAGIDGFLIATLDLIPPPKDDRSIFAATLHDVRGRVDADFHSPRFRAIREGIESGKYPAKPLSELCTRFESGFAAGKQDQAFDYDIGVPHLRPLNMNAAGELSLVNTKFVPKSAVSPSDYCAPQDVLFNNTNSAEMVGKSDVFEFEQPCACSNHMTRLRAAPGVNPHYLAAIFNMFRRLGYFSLLATKFNNQAGINLDTLKPLRVPAPPSDVQEAISAEARRRREEAYRLRAEAEGYWQAAKHWFEDQLLGPVQP